LHCHAYTYDVVLTRADNSSSNGSDNESDLNASDDIDSDGETVFTSRATVKLIAKQMEHNGGNTLPDDDFSLYHRVKVKRQTDVSGWSLEKKESSTPASKESSPSTSPHHRGSQSTSPKKRNGDVKVVKKPRKSTTRVRPNLK
jgi:hypothetical protein